MYEIFKLYDKLNLEGNCKAQVNKRVLKEKDGKMKNYWKPVFITVFVIGVFMAGTMLGGGMDVQALSGTKEDSARVVENIAEQFADTANDPFNYTSDAVRKKALKRSAEQLPAKFDLRDVEGVSYVTPVKFQEPWGSCWGFAAIAAAETSILGDNELKGNYTADIKKEADPDGKEQMELSEKHLSYFARIPINDPSNPQNGEGDSPILLDDDEDFIAAAYQLGGFAPTATSVFATGIGPVKESENPLFEYKGKNGTVKLEWIDDKYQKFCYSEDDDWKIDESLRFSSSFSLKESFVVPSPAKIQSDEDVDSYQFDEAGVAAIKEQLYNKRGVEIGYKGDTFIANQSDHGDYINSNYAQYTYEVESPQHAVCIVGWDDNYKAQNFWHEVDENEDGYTAKDTIPPGDGAWLVKNSWGSGEEEFPNRGDGAWGIIDPVTGKHTGYFWLSYYDKSISTPEALDFEPNEQTDAGHTDIIDQHDYMPISKYCAAHIKDEVRTANIFKAGTCEEVKKVSCETTYPDTEVRFDVYLLAKGAQSPTDGILMDSVSRKFTYGGFHKVDLAKPFMVMKGQQYSIVVTQTVPESNGKTSYAVAVKNGNGKSVVNKGESYLFAGGEWQDFSSKKLREDLIEKTPGGVSSSAVDNFPIKGYAEKKPEVMLVVDYSGYMALTDPYGNANPPIYFMSWFTDNTGSDVQIDKNPVWRLAEGGEEIIDLLDGRDPSRKTVKCKKLGWTYLTVSADGIGTVVLSIKPQILSMDVTSMKKGKDSLALTLENLDQKGLEGCEVRYRVKGTSGWKIKEFAIGSIKSNTVTLTGLMKGKRYEVSACGYVDTKYGRVRGEWSWPTESETIGLANTLSAKGKTITVKASKLKKKSIKIARKKAIKVSGAKGTLSYKRGSITCKKKLLKGAKKKIIVSKKTGKFKLKKGLKKGSYKVKVKVTAAGDKYYFAGAKTVTVKIRVK